jgi:hypothetical protein
MHQPNPKSESKTMDTTVYAVVGLLNSLAYDARQTSPVIPDPEFQSFNFAHMTFKRNETQETPTNLRGNVSDALPV